jgi:hypothetical protein
MILIIARQICRDREKRKEKRMNSLLVKNVMGHNDMCVCVCKIDSDAYKGIYNIYKS